MTSQIDDKIKNLKDQISDLQKEKEKEKEKEKADRAHYLSDQPIVRTVREIKRFDNIEHFKSYISKHWSNIQHNECSVFGSGNSVYGWGLLDEHFIIHIKADSVLENILDEVKEKKPIFNPKNALVCSLWINRMECKEDFNARQILIAKYKKRKTQQLLKFRRHAGPAGFYLHGWERQVLKAILDTREHVLRASDRKRIRLEKAKFQKT